MLDTWEAKRWLKFYREDLKASSSYPEIPLQDMLDETAEKYPERTAVIYRNARISYRELNRYTDFFASALTDLGVRKDCRVALFMPNTLQFIIAFYGALKAGAIVVPCNPMYREGELEFQLNDSGAELVVATRGMVAGRDLYEVVAKIRDRTKLKHVVTTGMMDPLPSREGPEHQSQTSTAGHLDTVDFMKLLYEYPRRPSSIEIDVKNDVAALQYTGGTTGPSKGAMLTHFNLVCNAIAFSRWLDLKGGEVCLTVLPLFHSYGLTTAMNTPIYSGCSMLLLPRFDAEEVLSSIERERVSIFCGVPTMYIALLNHPDSTRYNLSSLKKCVSGASPLSKWVAESFMKLTSAKLVEGYGLSEASPVTHCNPLEAEVKLGSIGIPILDTDAKIVDLETGCIELQRGEVGELVVKGPQVMKGYWNRREESEGVLRDGWLYTGDVAYMDEDGYFYIVDRRKDMINVAGFKVWPKEVEDLLLQHPCVREAGVIGAPDCYRGEAVKAFIVLKDEWRGKVAVEDVKAFCMSKLAAYKAPQIVEFRDTLPKSAVGKVLRRVLREI